MKTILATWLLLSAAVTASAASRVFPFDPVKLPDNERTPLEAAARPFGHGAQVAAVEAGALLGDLAMANVQFAESLRTDDMSMRFAVACGYSAGTWKCDDSYRIVTLLRDVPAAEIELRGEVSIWKVHRIVQFIRRRFGVGLIAVSAIERDENEGYRVEVTNVDGFGVHGVTEKDLATNP